MFGYLLGQADGNRIICERCFLHGERFTVLSVDTGIPPDWGAIEQNNLQLDSINRECVLVWGGRYVYCRRCSTRIGDLENNIYSIYKAAILYYRHDEVGFVYRFDPQTTFVDGIPNLASLVSRFRYDGIDGYLCRFCVDANVVHLVAPDIPSPAITPPAITENGLVVRPPNRYHNNLVYAPMLDYFIQPFQAEHDYSIMNMICGVCHSTVGSIVQEVAPGWTHVYRFNFAGIIYRRYGSIFQLPQMHVYFPHIL